METRQNKTVQKEGKVSGKNFIISIISCCLFAFVTPANCWGRSPNRLFPCSKEAIGKKVLPFLWCTGMMCGGTRERVVKEGLFSLKLIGFWQEKPTVVKYKLDWDTYYRFMNKDPKSNKQWVSVEFLDPPENVSVKGNIGMWVELPLMLTGKPHLNVPDNQNYKFLTFQKTGSDQVFIKKHKLKQMASYRGVIKIEDTICCVYIVVMQRGRKSWKVEVVFPISKKNNGKNFTVEDCKKEIQSPINCSTAAIWLGHFKILDDNSITSDDSLK